MRWAMAAGCLAFVGGFLLWLLLAVLSVPARGANIAGLLGGRAMPAATGTTATGGLIVEGQSNGAPVTNAMLDGLEVGGWSGTGSWQTATQAGPGTISDTVVVDVTPFTWGGGAFTVAGVTHTSFSQAIQFNLNNNQGTSYDVVRRINVPTGISKIALEFFVMDDSTPDAVANIGLDVAALAMSDGIIAQLSAIGTGAERNFHVHRESGGTGFFTNTNTSTYYRMTLFGEVGEDVGKLMIRDGTTGVLIGAPQIAIPLGDLTSMRWSSYLSEYGGNFKIGGKVFWGAGADAKFPLDDTFVPEAPTSPVATQIALDKIRLTWRTPDGSASTSLVRSKVERNKNLGGWTTLYAALAANTVDDEDVSDGDSLDYRFSVVVDGTHTSASAAIASPVTVNNAAMLPYRTDLKFHAMADAEAGGNGSALDPWIDLSGEGNNATAIGSAQRPTLLTNVLNGKPVVQFDGTSDWLRATIGSYSAQTIMFPARRLSTTGTDGFVGRGYGATPAYTYSDGTALQWWAGSASFGGSDVTSWNIYTIVVASTSSATLYKNGQSVTTFDPHDSVASSTVLDIGAIDGNDFGHIQIPEIAVWGADIGSTNREDCEDYMGTKYNLTVTH